jgi:UDP-glucose 4-epimerase
MAKRLQALVTGGAGFIGSHLVERLVSQGASVRVLDDLSSGHLRNLASVKDDVEFFEGSVLDNGLLARASAGADAIFHLAAIVSVTRSVDDPVGTHEVNVLGTVRALEEARKNGSKFVFSSSAAVYGDGPEQPKTEDLEPGPLSPYGVQKLTGEQYVACYARLHGVEGFSLRYFNVYGPRQDASSPYSGVISRFSELALDDKHLTIHGDGHQTRDFVYVHDVVEANIAAMKCRSGFGQTFNVATGRSVSLNELASAVKELSGSVSEVVHGPARAGDIRFSTAEVSKAASELGFSAKFSLMDGLSETVLPRLAEPAAV